MKFGDFEVNAASGELRRHGARVKLQDLPFRVLVLLVTRAGEVVTRDQLRAELWGAETFVDAEAGLNTAINKLREALGDSADAPRFIETLPKRGYRFIGPVERDPEASPGRGSGPPDGKQGQTPSTRVIAALLVVAVLVAAFSAWRWRTASQRTVIAVVLFHNETGDPRYDQLAQTLTDATVVALAANRHYAVIGNAAVLRTPRIFADIQKIGAALNAEYLVLGQVQNTDGTLTVRAHFIRTRDQTHLWAKGIQGDASHLDVQVPKTIADAIDGLMRK
jgi:DNA-binding winged helix-turn-helix (wHTH) protein/TolB-like protein